MAAMRAAPWSAAACWSEVKLDAADAKVEVGGKRLVLSTMVGFLESSEADLGLQVKQEL